MSELREPNYFCLDVRAAKIVKRLGDKDRLEFFDRIFELYLAVAGGETEFAFPDTLLGDLLKQAADTLLDGFTVYQKRVNARSGKKDISDESTTDHRSINDQPSISQRCTDAPHIIEDQQSYIQDDKFINSSTISALRAEGFDDDEIRNAASRVRGRTVTDPVAYLRKAIINNREKQKVSAQDYNQRPYDAVQARVEADMALRVAEHEKRKAALTG